METGFQGVYVQIPFCLKKCFYCDFPSYAGKEDLIGAYIDALSAEIASAPCFSPPESVYFGGGTPSILTAQQMAKAVDALKRNGWWSGVQERTFETNPGTVDVEKLTSFREMGFNRISIGVQTFSGAILESVGRVHTGIQAVEAIFREMGFNRISIGVQTFSGAILESVGRVHTGIQAVEAIQAAREAGFRNINVDLMYGLPGQDLLDLRTNFDLAIKLGATHVSVYGLTVEEGTPLEEMLKNKTLTLPGPDVEEQMYDLMSEYLPRKDYLRYEISNFALRGYQCKHNTIYWRYQNYKGFGSAACSFDGEQRVTNTICINEYVQAYWQKEPPPANIEKIDKKTAMAEFVFMGLRMSEGISPNVFKTRFKKDIMKVYGKEIEENIKNGWMIDDGQLKLTPEGMKVGNKIFLTFLPLTY